jgi:antitoxin ParD1/3/4
MTFKTSISLTEEQEAFARALVDRGQYASLSAVLQHGVELVRAEQEARDVETLALRALLAERLRGGFVSVAEGRRRTQRMLRQKKAAVTRAGATRPRRK